MSGFDANILQAASEAQKRALAPELSVWVSASAGTGKTEVLTRRLMALLLSDAKLRAKEIVALTFTRAGAAEMAARLPERLAKWAKLDEVELIRVVKDELGLEVEGVVARVKALAEEVVRDGPVVTTIHGLGQMLLAGFPREAGVPVGFGVLEDGERARMLQEIQHGLLVREGALAEDLAVLLDELGDHGWRELTDLMVRDWRKLREVLGDGDVDDVLARLDDGLALLGNEGWALGPLKMEAEEFAALQAVVAALPEHDAAEVLRVEGNAREAAWRSFLLTDKDTPRARLFVKKDLVAVGEATEEIFRAAQARLAEQLRLRRVLRGKRLTEALLRWGAAVREGYAAYKRDMGMLDYDDLLEGLERLLGRTEAGMAEWVWYVLDRKFRHMVVDEAQDNNPQQDRIVRLLMKSMLAGEVGEERGRSVLAVGDVKQSIFRFQGAVPELFLDLQREMQRWAGENFRAVDIQHSFRSGRHVLAATDAVFGGTELAREVMGMDQDWLPHVPVAKERAGRVEVWPLVAEEKGEAVGAWALPQERFAAGSEGGEVACFKVVGAWLKEQWQAGTAMPSTGKAMQWEDVMVVVQRNRVAGIAAGVLRRMGIPVAASAGVMPQAVQDVCALLRVMLVQEDHLALATVLKGLRGWNDAQLLKLAAWSGEGAWVEALPEADAVWLQNYLGVARPLAVVQRAVGEFGFELTEFEPLLEWAEQAETVAELVARLEREDLPVAGGGAGVRIMTVHGAKGLQAPLVILPDTMARMGDVQDKVLWGEDTVLVKGRKGTSAFEDDLVDREAKRRRADALRGLYVAMTRASDWLVVCGWGKAGEKDTWWSLVRDTVGEEGGWREEDGIHVLGDQFQGVGRTAEAKVAAKLPGWLSAPAARALVGG